MRLSQRSAARRERLVTAVISIFAGVGALALASVGRYERRHGKGNVRGCPCRRLLCLLICIRQPQAQERTSLRAYLRRSRVLPDAYNRRIHRPHILRRGIFLQAADSPFRIGSGRS